MFRYVPVIIALCAPLLRADDPPWPDPKNPVDYTAWLNARCSRGISENAADVYRKAFEAFVQDETAFEYAKRWDKPWKDYEKRKLQRWLEQNRECLELFGKAARMRKCYFELKSESGAAIDIVLVDVSPIRNVSRMLAARARLRAEGGDVGRAAEDVATLLQVGRHMGSQPPLISYLVGLATRASGYDLLLRLPKYAGERADYQAVLRAIRRVDRRPARLKLQLASERILFLDTLQRAGVDTDGDGALDVLRFPQGMGLERTEIEINTPLSALIAEYDGFYEGWQRIANADYRTGDRLQTELNAELKSRGSAVVRVLMFDLWQPILLYHRVNASRSAAHIVLHIHAYKAEHGNWPENLKAAKVPSSMRKDPFSGKEFVYRVTDGEPLLYSVSENGQDDGGQPADDGKRWSDTGDAIFWPPAEK